jgi:hypothetical protein
LSARPILHSIEHIDQTHGRLLYEPEEDFSGYDVAMTGTWQARGGALARAIFTNCALQRRLYWALPHDSIALAQEHLTQTVEEMS